MFESSFVENRSNGKSRKVGTIFLSAVLQASVLGALLLWPLIYTNTLDAGVVVDILRAPLPPPPPPPPPPPEVKVVKKVKVERTPIGTPTAPRKIPDRVVIIIDEELPQDVLSETQVLVGVPGGVGPVTGVDTLARVVPPPPPPVKVEVVEPKPEPRPQAPQRVSSGVISGLLVKQVRPTYPSIARQARVQGTVVLSAMIGKDGRIQNLQVKSGPAMLRQAALDAVREWQYRPYLLNNEPVEVLTEIEVNFALQ